MAGHGAVVKRNAYGLGVPGGRISADWKRPATASAASLLDDSYTWRPLTSTRYVPLLATPAAPEAARFFEHPQAIG